MMTSKRSFSAASSASTARAVFFCSSAMSAIATCGFCLPWIAGSSFAGVVACSALLYLLV